MTWHLSNEDGGKEEEKILEFDESLVAQQNCLPKKYDLNLMSGLATLLEY